MGAGSAHPPPPRDDLRFSNTTGILPKIKTMWFIGVKVKQETSARPPKKNPGSATASCDVFETFSALTLSRTFPCYFSKLHVIEEGKR